MPFAGYASFADCVSQNAGKVRDAEAYCAAIMRKSESGKVKRYRVKFRDGRETIIEASSPDDARSKGRGWYMSNVRYYGASPGANPHKREQAARRSYIRAQKPTSVEEA